MSDFSKFSEIIHTHFQEMAEDNLFQVGVEDDVIWTTYLQSFPDGTNEIVKERTYHDCSCCKHFVRNIGNLVTIKDGIMTSVWDVEGLEYPYDIVAAKLSELVHNLNVNSVFIGRQALYGAALTRSHENGEIVEREHFHGNVSNHLSNRRERDIGDFNESARMLNHALNSFKESAFENVLELIKDNNLYRGKEFENSIKAFFKVLKEYNELKSNKKDLFAWEYCRTSISRFKNTVIGTLISDLSSGVEIDKAVKSFEAKVAPENYKRSKSLITEGMIKSAMDTIDNLEIRDSLERRFANISDISVNNVIFADRSSQPLMKDSLVDSLMAEVKPKKVDEKNVIDISINDFVKDIMPETESIEVFVKNSQKKNFMSLTAPVKNSPNIFKWDNQFAWSYDGDIADSAIKEKVRAAGGNVSAPFRVSLAWYNYDDLDIHVKEPNSRREIFYSNKKSVVSDGFLDIDMNAGGNHSREPVENVCWNKPIDGKHIVYVNNFTKRESVDVGFSLEVENNGNIHHFTYSRPVIGKVKSLEIDIRDGIITNIKTFNKVEGGMISQDYWGVKTQEFKKVNLVMNSPNHWDGNNTGNKHWFFLIEDCKNPDKARGFYNEFLASDFMQHRKVFEILGAKTKCEVSDQQLSGLGFSETKNEEVLIKVRGKQNRIFNVQF